MGTWDHGLLDNDTALDGLGDLTQGIVEDIQAAASTERLSAAVGVLLQLSSYDFSPESSKSAAIIEVLKGHVEGFAALSLRGRAVLEQIVNGQGLVLAERRGTPRAGEEDLLHVSGGGFGVREDALFVGPDAESYVQEVADRCVDMVDEDFADEGNWSDLCREGIGMGGMGVLLVLEPCYVPRATIERWRKAAATGLEQLEKSKDEELDFQRLYYRNIDHVCGALLRRFSA